MDAIRQHEEDVLSYAHQRLSAVDGLRLIGTAAEKSGVVSFTMDCAHPHDISTIIDNDGVAIRAGHHCAQPAMRHFGVDTTLRVSAGIYNDEDDIAVFLQNLRDLKKYF